MPDDDLMERHQTQVLHTVRLSALLAQHPHFTNYPKTTRSGAMTIWGIFIVERIALPDKLTAEP
jgi:hypothetical protein